MRHIWDEVVAVIRDAVLAAMHRRIIEQARDLRSEEGENPEYDRALVELTMRTIGLAEDDRAEVEFWLGIIKPVTRGDAR